jgi:tetratricopeptide (TPR) repeat protein
MIARALVASLVVAAVAVGPALAASRQDARPAPPRRQTSERPRPDATREQVLRRADAALAAGRAAEAAQLYAEAADGFHSVEALLKSARLQSSRGDARGAMASLGRARDLAPNSEEVLSAYAQLALATRALLPAVATLEALARMCPTVAQYHYWLGVGLMQAGDMVPALEALQRADQMEPDKPLTLAALGLAMNVRKMYGEARAVLMRSLGHDPDRVETIAALAEAEAGLGNVDAAESYAQRALAKAPDNATANLAMGLAHMQRGRFAEAITALRSSLETEPTNPKGYYQLSLAYARIGDEASAQKYVDLYKQKLDDMERYVMMVRRETGFSMGGMVR